MVQVIELDAGQDPPDDRDYYAVARDPTGHFYVADSDVGFVRSFQAASCPMSEDERASAINRAAIYADKHGVEAVYVVN
jgi:hypothetical protein